MDHVLRRDLVAVTVVAVLVSLPGIPLAVAAEAPCTSVHFGDCWGAPIAAGLYGLASPLLLWVGLAVARVSRHFWIALTAAMLAVVLAMLAGGIVELAALSSPAAPWVLPVGVGASLGAAVAVRRASRPWVAPACLAGALAALWVAAYFFTSIQAERQQVEDFDSFDGELYMPDVPAATASHSWMSTYPVGPAIRYEMPDGPGVVVHLLEAEAGGMCATMYEYEHQREDCVERGGAVRIDAAVNHHTVAVQRGDTVLMAEWNNTSPDAGAVLEALREAGAVSAEELAGIG